MPGILPGTFQGKIMEKIVTLQDRSKCRSYFERDTQFINGTLDVGVLVSAYEKATIKSERSAKNAIESGEISAIRAAQWDSAVVQTLEAAMCACKRNSDAAGQIDQDEEIELPNKPNFS